MGDVVVTPVQYSGTRRSRNLEERLMIRFPGIWRALAALVQRRLSPRSRLRRTLLCREVVTGWAASSRRDYELVLILYAPDAELEFEFDPEFEALGMGGTFRGRAGKLQMFQEFEEAWERWEMLPALVLDTGERVLVLGSVRHSGAASGLEFEREFAQLVKLEAGLVAHQQEFFGWDKGLRAAGLDPDAIALPSRAEAAHTAAA